MKISKILPRILILMLCIGIFSSTFFGATDINGALAISASDTVFEDFEYPSLEGSSVANADKWSVNYELTGGSKSGSEAKIIKNPANVSEYVLDVHNLGGGASENLQAIMNVDMSVQDYTIISSKLMFSQASTVLGCKR